MTRKRSFLSQLTPRTATKIFLHSDTKKSIPEQDKDSGIFTFFSLEAPCPAGGARFSRLLRTVPSYALFMTRAAQPESFRIARPTPIRSAFPSRSSFSAPAPVTTPPVSSTGTETFSFTAAESRLK